MAPIVRQLKVNVDTATEDTLKMLQALTHDEWHNEFTASRYDLLSNDSTESMLDIIIRMFADDRLYRIVAEREHDGFGDFIINPVSDN